MNIWTLALYGLPGSGKTTLGRALAVYADAVYCGVGDLVRMEIDRQTSFGLKVASVLHTKKPYPVGLLTNFLESYIKTISTSRIIIDGYPKTPAEVTDAKNLFDRVGRPITHILQIDVTAEEAFNRTHFRIICSSCQYPVSGVYQDKCPQCGSKKWLKRDSEDNKKDFMRRYRNYLLWTPQVIADLRNDCAYKIMRVDCLEDKLKMIKSWLNISHP